MLQMEGRAILCVAVSACVCTLRCTLLSGVDDLQEAPCVDQCDSGQTSQASSSDAQAEEEASAVGADAAEGSIGTGSPNPGSQADDSGAFDSGIASDSGLDGGKDAAPPTIARGYAAAVMADSPLGYWPLGDPVTSATCEDASGNGHPGNLVGAVTLGAAGPFSDGSLTAATFDGSAAEEVDVGPSFDFSGTTPFSWEVWVKPNTLPGSPGAFLSTMVYDNSGGPATGEYLIAYSGGQGTLGFEMYGTGGYALVAIECSGTGGLFVNQWSYIVATWDGAGDSVVYVDGVESGEWPGAGGRVPAFSVNTLIGQFFNGAISEVAIYGHALTEGQVHTHWQAGLSQ